MIDQLKGFVSLFFVLILFVLVLFLAYHATKFLGKRFSMSSAGTRYIKVLDRVVVGQDRVILLLQVGGKTMLVGMTQQGVAKLSDIDEEDLVELSTDAGHPAFSDTLKDILKNNWGIGSASRDSKEGNSQDDRKKR